MMKRRSKKVLRLPRKMIDREIEEMIRKCNERKDTVDDWTRWRELQEMGIEERYAPFLEDLTMKEMMNTTKGRIMLARIIKKIKEKGGVK